MYNRTIINEKYQEAELLIHGQLGHDDMVYIWWNTPNEDFGGELPMTIWSENPDIVLNHLRKRTGGW